MLKMNKSLVGMTVATALLAGCSTASKNNFADTTPLTMDEINSSFYTDGGERSLASFGEPFAELLKLARTSAVKAASKSANRSIEKELLTFVNRVETKEVQALKEAKFAAAESKWKAAGSNPAERPQRGRADALDANDIEKLAADDQARIVKQFMENKKWKEFPQLSGIYNKVDARVKELLAADAAKNGGLSKDMEKTLAQKQANNSKFMHDAVGANASYAELRNQAREMVEKMGKDNADFNTAAAKAEAEALVLNARKNNAYIMRATGGKMGGLKNFTVNSCDGMTMEGLQKFDELLADVRKGIEEFPVNREGRIACKNFDEIAAFAAAKFQEKLGRTGLSALVAVEEMTFCHYLDPKVGGGAKNLQKKGKGALVKPECL